jgi:hypothetical protein
MAETEMSVSRRQRLPRELVTAIYEGACVLFLGAGLSQVYAGLPGGGELARRLGRELLNDPTLTDAKRRFLEAQLDQDTTLNLSGIARYYSQHNRGDPHVSGRARLLVALSKNLDVDLSEQQLDDLAFLAKYPWRAIYTTNYDMVVEHVLDHADVPYHRISKNDDLLALRQRPSMARKLVKLHGSIDELFHDDDGLRLVLTDTDYHFYREGRELLFHELRNDLAKYPFLFMGYGLRDEHFTRLVALLNQLVNLRQRASYVLARWQDINPFDQEQRAHEGQITIPADLREFVANLEFMQEQDRFDSDLLDLMQMRWPDRLTFRKQADELAKRLFDDSLSDTTSAADSLRWLIDQDLMKAISLLDTAKPRQASTKYQQLMHKELQAVSGRFVDLFDRLMGDRVTQPRSEDTRWQSDCELTLRALPVMWHQLDPSNWTGDDSIVTRRRRLAQLLRRFIFYCDDAALAHIASRSISECVSRHGFSPELLDAVETILSQLDEPYGDWRRSGAGAVNVEVLALTEQDERRPAIRALKWLLEPLRDYRDIEQEPRLRRVFDATIYANPHVHWELLALGIRRRQPPVIDLLRSNTDTFVLHAAWYLRSGTNQEVLHWLSSLDTGTLNESLRWLVEEHLPRSGLFERRAIALLAAGCTGTGMRDDPIRFITSVESYLDFLEAHHLTGPVYPLLTVPALVESILRFKTAREYGAQEVALYRRLLSFTVRARNPLLWQASIRRLTQFLPEMTRHDETLLDEVRIPLQELAEGWGEEADPWLMYRAMSLLGELLDEPLTDGTGWREFREWAAEFLAQPQSRPLHEVVRRRLQLRGRPR